MLPASAWMKPPRMWRKVLLPQPLGPMTVMNSPSRALNSPRSRIGSGWPFFEYDLRMPEACSAIVLIGPIVAWNARFALQSSRAARIDHRRGLGLGLDEGSDFAHRGVLRRRAHPVP